MRTVNAELTILDIEDIGKRAVGKNIRDITQKDVRDFNIVKESEILIYKNIEGQTKVLKNRYF